jgi:HK97 family phage major capsid protein
MATYAGAAITPGQTFSFRDLIPTRPSPNGTVITYREGSVSNSFAIQTEGSAKAAQDYTWSEVKATSQYIAAKTKFSKQLMYNLDFIEGTLAQELMRDFLKKENDYFFITTAQAATGVNTAPGNPTVDIEQLVTCCESAQGNFYTFIRFVDPAQWVRFLLTKPNDYSLPPGTVVNNNGNIIVAGTPIIQQVMPNLITYL